MIQYPVSGHKKVARLNIYILLTIKNIKSPVINKRTYFGYQSFLVAALD